jgi:hypothetical protein
LVSINPQGHHELWCAGTVLVFDVIAWKSRSLGGRPQIALDLRALMRRMSVENLLWGAPRIRGELLKLGFAVAQSTVANSALEHLPA